MQAVHLQMTSKTATIQYKPVTSLAGNNNVVAHYEQSRGFDQISHALSNIHGLYQCSCNLFDVISVYSFNPRKLPGRFSYERPGYEAIASQDSCHGHTTSKLCLPTSSYPTIFASTKPLQNRLHPRYQWSIG